MYLLLALALSGPSVRLSMWPAGARVWQGQAVYTGARVVVSDPEGAIPCPEIRVDWGDGSKSSAQSISVGCDPFTQPGGTYRFYPKLHPYREASGCDGFKVTACVVAVNGECKSALMDIKRVVIRRAEEECDMKAKWAAK